MAETGGEERGAIYTRREVVDFILDLVDYTVDQPLHQFRLLEPSFGNGDFLLPVVERLLTAYVDKHSDLSNIVEDLSSSIRAVEVHRDSVERTHKVLSDFLGERDVNKSNVERLLGAWIIEGDFLLVDLPHQFTHAVGNPPYVRQELIPDALMAEYRARYVTIYDRADLYVPFIERSLNCLEPSGVGGFICADRWMKNKYGRRLREMVATDYHLACYIDMVNTPAFHSEVSAYPAITIIRREKSGSTRVIHRPQIDPETLSKLTLAIRAKMVPADSGVTDVRGVVNGAEPWILQSFDQLKVVRRLEADFPTLEDAGCKVGIGVATGADKVFIGPYEELDVEPDRKLPLVMTKDIETGTVEWRGFGVINPFNDDGSLVELADYPRFARHLEKYSDVVRRRNCAKKNPKRWYRTIDRIYPGLANKPKLLIPDIKGEAHIVYENGRLYPHHNLYVITSDDWDLKALQAVLCSGIAKLFVSIYSTQMRGGYLRFQAQYLRRIRLPKWSDVSKDVRQALVEAAQMEDVAACNLVVFELYGLNDEERAAIGGNGDAHTK